ncbi:hypothetical protein [Deinococcus roseus]|uniref:Uncharacterized protein n=1 Tax=Deinococcus roseus TaxID=392414 RepID=A0ABQ2DGA0_9DEIO|nr:hypothetical protein [Deinococcus roseus]GGJ56553.1 hypothetical protein GCM10008938_48380 [Deinococcus roseus]
MKRWEFILLSTLACFGVLSLIHPPVVIRERVILLAPEPEPAEPEEVQE